VIAEEKIYEVRFNGRRYVVKCSPKELNYLARGLAFVEGLKGDFSIEQVDLDEFEKVECKERWSLREIESSLKYIDLNDPTKAHHIAVIVGKNGMIARAVDVSRHNVIYKVIGKCLENGLNDFSRFFLLISSRVTFDVALKCYKAKIPLIVTKKAVTDLAVEVCKKAGISLVSFGSGVVVGDAVESSDTCWR
jgi:FdhD protein